MIDLSDVTLVSIDTTDRINETLTAVYTSMNGIKYGSVKLVTDKDPPNLDSNITMLPNINSTM